MDDILKAVSMLLQDLLDTDDYATDTEEKALESLMLCILLREKQIQKEVSKEAQKCGLGNLFLKMSESLQSNYTCFDSSQLAGRKSGKIDYRILELH